MKSTGGYTGKWEIGLGKQIQVFVEHWKHGQNHTME